MRKWDFEAPETMVFAMVLGCLSKRLRSRLALKQAKDLARTCSSQSESYEKLLKRRQQEVRHLQEG